MLNNDYHFSFLHVLEDIILELSFHVKKLNYLRSEMEKVHIYLFNYKEMTVFEME